MSAAAAAEGAARVAYGRLLSVLARRTRDVAGAEDALADAFRAALERWPRDGVPDNPAAWLLTAARRRLDDGWRRDRVRSAATDTLRLLADEAADRVGSSDLPDERLKLMFICAHPAIDPAVRTPLMLQTVLGLDAARIAAAFLVAPAAMGQRLVRAKAKIRDARIPFATPDRHELQARLAAVADAVYAAYGAGWDPVDGPGAAGLAAEGLFLARLLAALLPEEPEARGLAALILHCEARRPARRDAEGRYVPLSLQDPGLWSAALAAEAEAHLEAAFRCGRPGRYQLEAAIQSAHAERRVGGSTPWAAILSLYDALLRHAPTVGARVARAAALGEAEGPGAGLSALDVIGADANAYQPYWATRGCLEMRAGLREAGRSSLRRAAALSHDPATRDWLAQDPDGKEPFTIPVDNTRHPVA